MKNENRIRSIGVRTVIAVTAIAIAAVMSGAGPVFNGPSVASAQAKGIQEKAFWLGPYKICLGLCLTNGTDTDTDTGTGNDAGTGTDTGTGYCCEVKGQL